MEHTQQIAPSTRTGNRTLVAMHALSAMRLYHPVFPNDNLPFHAIALAMNVGDVGDLVVNTNYFEEYEKSIRDRLRTIDTMVQDRNLKRGWLCASAEALHLVMMSLADYPDPEASERVRVAAFDMVTELGFAFV